MEGIIVGVDESDHAQAALRWAVDHAAQSAQPLTAVMAWGYIDQHHLEPGVPFDPEYTSTIAANVLADQARLHFVVDGDELVFYEKQPGTWSDRVARQVAQEHARAERMRPRTRR